jgi:hypothetical protein
VLQNAFLPPNQSFSPTPMLTTDTLAPEDSALIEREAGSVLKALYAPLVHEPLPERFTVLLEQLAVREPARDRDDSKMGA